MLFDVLKPITLISLFTVIVGFSQLDFKLFVFSQDVNNNHSATSSWISKRNNFNASMMLEPKIPIIDQKTKISFEIKRLNDTGFFEGLIARATITDHDGRLFKFDRQSVLDGKFAVEYMFPDHGAHRIILQLYKYGSAFAIGSFDIMIPHQQEQSNQKFWGFFANLFDNLFNNGTK